MYSRFTILAALITLAISACTAGEPISPSSSSDQVPVLDAMYSPDSGRTLWGIWQITIDPETVESTVTPSRFGTFHANVRKFLEEGPCTNCLSIVPPIVPTAYGIDATLRIEHPFPGDAYYTGFDVRGILMLEGTYNFPNLLLTTTRASTGEWALLNPDGYSTIFNAGYTDPGIFGYSHGTMIPPTWPDPPNELNAFKAYYSEGQSEDDGSRRAFIAGDVIDRTYEIQLQSAEPLMFWYAIDASWEPPNGEEPYDVWDFPYSANCPEPYRFDFSVVAGELYPDSGSVTIGVDIYDHQGLTEPWAVQYEAPECMDGVGVIITAPDYIDGDRHHWEFGIPNLNGGLDINLGVELLVGCVNNDPDPYTGEIDGWGRFTIPVSVEPTGCNDALHENFLGTGDFSGAILMEGWDAVFVHDTGTLVDGEFLGYISGFGGTIVQPYIIDTLIPETGHPLQGSGWGNPHIASWPTPLSIDVSEELGQFFIVWNDTGSMVEVWSATTGKYAGETDASNNGVIYCLDTDGSGGFWNGFFPEVGFAPGIMHFTPDGPLPGELLEDTANTFLLPEVWGTPTEVICIPGETLLVLTGSQQGKIRAYDLSTTPPTFAGSLDQIFSGNLASSSSPARSCDMAIDWSDTDLANCRIIVFGNLASGGVELVKIDTDLNVLAGPVSIPSNHYHSMDINPDTGDIALWPRQDAFGPGEYALIEQPVGW